MGTLDQLASKARSTTYYYCRHSAGVCPLQGQPPRSEADGLRRSMLLPWHQRSTSNNLRQSLGATAMLRWRVRFSWMRATSSSYVTTPLDQRRRHRHSGTTQGTQGLVTGTSTETVRTRHRHPLGTCMHAGLLLPVWRVLRCRPNRQEAFACWPCLLEHSDNGLIGRLQKYNVWWVWV